MAELVARFYVGLGDPPLSITDADIEYLFKPSQDVSRFGNRITYNAYSMRSDDFLETKVDPREFRMLIIGDSVVNGGSLTDQSELATELLKNSLAQAWGRPVTVGNISAGSWGPGNQLAYIQKYGLFNADLVVLVISSHDAGDVPTFEPIVGTSNFPEHKPVLALQEAVTRYLPRYLPIGVDTPGEPRKAKDPLGAIDDLERLITYVQDQGVDILIAHHPERSELAQQNREGFDAIVSVTEDLNVSTINLAHFYQRAIANDEKIYRDKIHPNSRGQRIIAEALYQAIIDRVSNQSGVKSLNLEAR